MEDLNRLQRAAKRALTIMNLEQLRGQVDGSVQQTRRMYLSVESARRAHGRLQRALRDQRRSA